MERFTISLDDELARQFDEFITSNGYSNRSEAIRDLIRARLGNATLNKPGLDRRPAWCVANVSYVYNHHEQAVTARVLDLQHDHHDLVITNVHTHLDHDHCMETVMLRGPTGAVKKCAEELVALRGVRHGNIHLVPLNAGDKHSHGASTPHRHFKPVN